MSNLSGIQSMGVRNAIGSQCHSKVTLAANSAGAATVKTTGAAIYSIDGVYYTEAALSAQSIAITHRFDGSPVTTDEPAYDQPSSTTVVYVVALNAAGTVAVVQGSYAGQAITHKPDMSRTSIGRGGVPALPAGYVAIGAIKVATAATATFEAGTDALNKANVTFTFFDLQLLPASL